MKNLHRITMGTTIPQNVRCTEMASITIQEKQLSSLDTIDSTVLHLEDIEGNLQRFAAGIPLSTIA